MNITDLYQELIIDHSRHPRNHGEIALPTGKAEGYNPLCGDKITVFLKIDNDIITEMRFTGAGCALSIASASLMTEALIGKPVATAFALSADFKKTLTTDAPEHPPLGKLEALVGARHFPARVKCVTLGWHTLEAAITQQKTPVTTELNTELG
jgi:nitrogen fixation NifU-like protein